MDEVFRALADPTRRHLLDRLREQNGLTLGELCEHVGMARQSVTQHLGVLEAANLVTTVRQGRTKLHYLNPVPLHDIGERWIRAFEHPRLRTISGLRRRAETAVDPKPSFVYVTYIRASAEQVWHALTDADLTASYWGHSNVSDWLDGSAWEHRRTDGSGVADVIGTVIESRPPTRLVFTMARPGADPVVGASRVAFDVEPHGAMVRLTVTHVDLTDEVERTEAAAGWSAVLANLKSLLETGQVLPSPPWEMPRR